ncbi:hypothetical protein D918_02046 [Trichuris suis]|nr:hypothetical protein D918_02046 [Trichuris suis]
MAIVKMQNGHGDSRKNTRGNKTNATTKSPAPSTRILRHQSEVEESVKSPLAFH